MKNSLGRGACAHAVVLGILGLAAFAASAEMPYELPVKAAAPETVIENWPGPSRLAARALIAKYGEPRRFDLDSLEWSDHGRLSKIVVYRTAPGSFFRRHENDVVEESIWYDVPDVKIAELQRFDDRLTVDKATGELSARAESEALDFLALNLADEIVAGERTAREARDFYRKTAQFSESGKSSPYMSGIIFSLRIPGRD
jgi:hypothetical protein